MNLKNRVGRFEINAELINSAPELFMAVMGRCIVVRCELIYQNTLAYIALSPEFDEVPQGEIFPVYRIEFHTEYEVPSFEFVRIDKE